MAAVGLLGGGAANIIVGYLVSGAVAAGIGPGQAGLLLTLGSALGVASRLFHGWLVDHRPFDALARVVVMFLVGGAGALALSVQTHWPTYWPPRWPLPQAGPWPGLFNLIVVRANRSAPAAATGVTQTGVYIGSLSSPVLAGVLIERSGYRAAWILTAAALTGAAVLAGIVRVRLNRQKTDGSESDVEHVHPTG